MLIYLEDIIQFTLGKNTTRINPQTTDIYTPDDFEKDLHSINRFDKPEDDSYPKMIELFCRSNFELREMTGIMPVHIDDKVSSLSAILLNDDY